MAERLIAESVVGWTWNVFIDSYPWTDGGALKAWRTKEAAEADALKEWGADAEPSLVRIVLIDGDLDAWGRSRENADYGQEPPEGSTRWLYWHEHNDGGES